MASIRAGSSGHSSMKVKVDGFRGGVGLEGGHQRAAVEADRGAGVLRRKADGNDAGDAVGAHLTHDVGDVRVPVAHRHVDGQRRASGDEGGFERTGLGEGPAGEGRGFIAGFSTEADLGVAVLQFLDDLMREGAAAGDFAEVFGHLAEAVRGSMSEEQDGCSVGLGHAWIILYWHPPSPDPGPKLRRQVTADTSTAHPVP